MICFIAGGLTVYLAIGSVYAWIILNDTLTRVPEEKKQSKLAYWLTNIILFCRWTCDWLPIQIHFWRKHGRS